MNVQGQKLGVTCVHTKNVTTCLNLDIEVLGNVSAKMPIFVATLMLKDFSFVLTIGFLTVSNLAIVDVLICCDKFLFVSKEHIFCSLADQCIVLDR